MFAKIRAPHTIGIELFLFLQSLLNSKVNSLHFRGFTDFVSHDCWPTAKSFKAEQLRWEDTHLMCAT